MIHTLAIFGIDDLLILTVVAGLLLAGMSLLLKKKPSKPNAQPPTLTERGSIAPVVIGRRRIAPIFCWGNTARSTGDNPVYYWAKGFHVLCAGPITKITRIWQDGKLLFDAAGNSELSHGGAITPANTTPGVLYSLPADKGAKLGLGLARFYWGTPGDPLDPIITAANALNIASCFPGFVKVVWDEKSLNTSDVWQEVEYEVELSNGYSPLTQSAQFIDSGGGVLGLNPAHAICWLITAQWPFGAGLDPSFVDLDSLEALGVLMASEGLTTNISSTKEAGETIGMILVDCGIMMSQVGTMLTFVAIRDPGTNLPILDKTVTDPSAPEVTNVMGLRRTTRLTFLYDDRSQYYKPVDIGITDHGNSNLQPTDREVQLPTITDLTTAAKVADRMQMGEMGMLSSNTLKARRGARLLTPGQAVNATGLGVLRITSVQSSTKSAEVVLETMQDTWGVTASSNVPDALLSPTDDSAVGPDLQFDWLELSPSIVVFRIRSSTVVTGAHIYGSVGGSFFQLPDQLQASAGGITNQSLAAFQYTVNNTVQLGGVIKVLGDASALGAGDKMRLNGTSQAGHNNQLFTVVTSTYDGTTFTSVVVSEAIPSPANSTGGTFNQEVRETGPIFTASNDDVINELVDLSGDTAAWQAGRQWLLLSSASGRELLYLRNVVSLGAGLYQLMGLMRAQQGTSNLNNLTGAWAYGIQRSQLQTLSDPLLTPGSLSVKSVPYTLQITEDIDNITAVVHTYT